MSYYFHIVSKLSESTNSNLVLNIKDGSTASVTPLVLADKDAGVKSQYWEFVTSGALPKSTFIASKLVNSSNQTLVCDIEGNNTASGTPVISYPKKSSGVNNQNWHLTEFKDDNGNATGYYTIESELADGANTLAMTVDSENPTAGTAVVSKPKVASPKKGAFAGSGTHTEFDAQLWAIVPIEYVYIESLANSNMVVTIKDNNPASVTPLVIEPKNPGVFGQLWNRKATGQMAPDGSFSNFFLESLLLNDSGQTLVADVEGNNTAVGTRVISYPMKTSGTNNQTWNFPSSQFDSGYFYIVSDLIADGANELVMTIDGGNVTAGTGVVTDHKLACGKKKGAFAGGTGNTECDYQLWALVPLPTNKTAFANKKQAFAS